MGTATPKSSVISVSIQSKISGVPLIAYRNQRVITSELLARGYGATPQQITNNFNRNKNRFIEGKHYFRIEGDDVENLRNSLRVCKSHQWQELFICGPSAVLHGMQRC
jgi:hypothetical protein